MIDRFIKVRRAAGAATGRQGEPTRRPCKHGQFINQGHGFQHLVAAETALGKALSLAPQHAMAHMFLGIVQLASKGVAQGIAEIEHALVLNWNLAEAHGCLGAAKLFVGRGAETEAHVQEALRLSPRDESVHRWMSWVGLSQTAP